MWIIIHLYILLRYIDGTCINTDMFNIIVSLSCDCIVNAHQYLQVHNEVEGRSICLLMIYGFSSTAGS